jgi:hypothetical protein
MVHQMVVRPAQKPRSPRFLSHSEIPIATEPRMNETYWVGVASQRFGPGK